MQMVDKQDHKYWYDFVCQGCGSEGRIGVPIEQRAPFGCPEGCGATYVQWFPPGKPATLRCVVRPFFAEAQ